MVFKHFGIERIFGTLEYEQAVNKQESGHVNH
jgi:hypothetical protein